MQLMNDRILLRSETLQNCGSTILTNTVGKSGLNKRLTNIFGSGSMTILSNLAFKRTNTIICHHHLYM